MLGHNLKEARENKGYTQQDVANIVGMNRVTYAKFEAGMQIPSLALLIPIAKLFDESLDNLLAEEMKQ